MKQACRAFTTQSFLLHYIWQKSLDSDFKHRPQLSTQGRNLKNHLQVFLHPLSVLNIHQSLSKLQSLFPALYLNTSSLKKQPQSVHDFYSVSGFCASQNIFCEVWWNHVQHVYHSLLASPTECGTNFCFRSTYGAGYPGHI